MENFEKTVFIGRTDRAEAVTVKIKFTDSKLSITGTIGRDHGGQIIGSAWDLESYGHGIDAETVQELRRIWGKWHLNDLQAGSPAQTAFLEANPVTDRANYYTAATAALAAAGLNPAPDYIHDGKPYFYGSAWLRIEVPAEVLHWLHQLPEIEGVK